MNSGQNRLVAVAEKGVSTGVFIRRTNATVVVQADKQSPRVSTCSHQ